MTGGAGFIGCHIVRALLERGDQVRVLDNFSTGHRDNLVDLFGDIDLIEGDLRSIDACRRAVKDMSYIFHQAALPSVPRSIEDPHTTHEVNATGTLHLLMAAREVSVKRVVYASSSSVYGPEPECPRVETSRPNPISPYAVSKFAGEQYCTAFFHSYGMETVSLRYFNVFGPRQGWDSPYAAVVPRFIHALNNGERPTIFGDGEQTRDFTYVDNVVEANLKALEAPAAPGNVYNVAAGDNTTVNQLLAMMCKAMKKSADPKFEPTRIGDVCDSLADISRVRHDLGYERAVSVSEGLQRTITWAAAQNA